MRDTATGDEWLLLDRRGLITGYAAYGFRPARSPADTSPPVAVVPVLTAFTATVDDFDGDGLLTEADGVRLIVSDASGRDAHFVTPEGSTVTALTFDAVSQRLYMLVLTDTNGDRSLNDLDEARPYMYQGPAKRGTVATALLSESIIDRAEAPFRQAD